MKHCIIPTVFAHSFLEFKARFTKLVKITNALQIDFMDGVLVPGISMPLSVVPELKKYKIAFEAHLMVADPEKWIAEIAKKGFQVYGVDFSSEAIKFAQSQNPEINFQRPHQFPKLL